MPIAMHFRVPNVSTVIKFHIETTVTNNLHEYLCLSGHLHYGNSFREFIDKIYMQDLQLACCVFVYKIVAADNRTQI
jgi:hypothetical protein